MANPLSNATIRIARPTNDLAALQHFYATGLGFDTLFEFRAHAGFDGLMLGLPSHGYHLEFTRQHGHDAGRAPSPEHLLVFYLPDPVQWAAAVRRLEGAGYPAVEPGNPYWAARGKTFEDPDGYRVVLQNESWSK